MPLAGEAAPDPTPLPTAATMASPPSRSTTPPSARVSRLLPSANLSIRPGVPVFFFTRSLSLYHYIEFAPPPRLGHQTPLDKPPPAPPLPTKIFVQHSPLRRIITRLFVMGATIAQSSVGCRVSLLGHTSPPAHHRTRPTMRPGRRRHAYALAKEMKSAGLPVDLNKL